jgi:hypothetical protein
MLFSYCIIHQLCNALLDCIQIGWVALQSNTCLVTSSGRNIDIHLELVSKALDHRTARTNQNNVQMTSNIHNSNICANLRATNEDQQ